MPVLKDASAVYLGDTEVAKIYAGETLVYDSNAPYQELTATSKSFFRFDEEGGVVDCINQTGVDGIYVGLLPVSNTQPGIAAPVDGTAMAFDGVEEYVIVAQPMALEDWSFSVWSKSADLISDQWIIEIGSVFGLLFSQGGVDGSYNVYGGGYATADPNDTAIQSSGFGSIDHIVYTKTGSTLRGYKNGLLSKTVEIQQGNFSANTDGFNLCTQGGTKEFYAGTIDETLIFDYGLSDEQVWLLFSGETGGPPPQPETGWFVSSSGGAGSAGTFADPWSMDHAFSAPVEVQAGDTIWVRGGLYKRPVTPERYTSDPNIWSSYLTGTSGQPVVMRAFQGEHVSIDLYNAGSPADALSYLRLEGDYCRYYDFEIYNTKPDSRITTETDQVNPTNDNILRGRVEDFGEGNQKINLVIHDLYMGLVDQVEGVAGVSYGVVSYNNGLIAQDPGGPEATVGREHNYYLQNTSAAPNKSFEQCISFNSCDYGFHAFGSGGDNLHNMSLTGCVSFNCGGLQGTTFRGQNWLVPSGGVSGNILQDENMVYGESLRYFARIEGGGDGLIFTGNYFAPGQTQFNNNWTNETSGGNTCITSVSGSGVPSSGITVVPTPTVNFIDVRANTYEAGRGQITVFNWEDLSSVNISLDGVVDDGSDYIINHVFDFYGDPIVSGTYATGEDVSLPLSDMTPPEYLGGDMPAQRVQSKQFGCFIVRTV